MTSKAFRSAIACLCWVAGLPFQANAQQLPAPEKPRAPFFYRSYKGTAVAPVRLANSDRLHALIRAGVLYLTVRDAIALAIENNLNLEIDRYALPSADWAVQRAEAGGPLRFAGSAGAAQVSAVDPGVGVLGALQASGTGGGGGGAGSVGGSGGGSATIQQVGPVVVNFDPTFANTTSFSHITTPFSNLTVSQTTALVDANRVYTTQIQQGMPTGGSLNIRDYEYAQKENSPGDTLNPVSAPFLRVFFQQPLLQNFGLAFNNHNIRVARIGTLAARETFRSELLNLVTTVVNLYWDLVRAKAELKIRQHALEIAEKSLDDTRKEIAIGALPRFQLTGAEAEVATRQQELILIDASVSQMEASLKVELTRSVDPAAEAAAIVPLDAIQIPDREQLPQLRELVAAAMKNRPDVALSKLNDESAAINAIGTANGLLPTLIAYAGAYNRGTAGTPQIANGKGPDPFFIGGYGSALGQVFRRDFPTEYAGVSLQQLPLHNRQAQADYGIEQLKLQASQLSGQKATNDIAVSVSNQVIALRQARARYSAAVNTRKLQEQLLVYEQEKFTHGTSTLNNIILDQRALVNAQLSEITALASYARARVGLDQVLGETLERYQITMDEGMTGRVVQ